MSGSRASYQRCFVTSIYPRHLLAHPLTGPNILGQLSEMAAPSQSSTHCDDPIRLHNLTPELLLQVASYLSQMDLLTLSSTNKHLKEVTEPELFREFIHTQDHGVLELFILRILERPYLAKHVRRVRLGKYYHLDDLSSMLDFLELFEDYELHRYQRFSEAAVEAGVIKKISPFDQSIKSVMKRMDASSSGYSSRSDQDWYAYLYDDDVRIEDVTYDVQYCRLLQIGFDEALVILLMALLPNVHELELWDVPCHRYSLPWRAVHQFQALRRLKATGFDDEHPWSLPIFHNVLQGGNLQSLQVYRLNTESSRIEENTHWEPQDRISRGITLSPRSTNITHLVLENCRILLSDMETILQACAPLKSLFFSSPDADEDKIGYTVPVMVYMLEAHKASLEYLALNMAVEWEIDGYFVPSPSFHDFLVLKKLETNSITWAELLVADQDEAGNLMLDMRLQMIDFLPPSLEEFIIQESWNLHGSEHWNYKHFESIILQRNKRLPKLRDIVIVQIEETAAQLRYEEFAAMAVSAAQRGLCFSLAIESQYLLAHRTPFSEDRKA